MRKTKNIFLNGLLSLLFIGMTFEPVHAYELISLESTRLNLILEEDGDIQNCKPLDPILSSSEAIHWVSIAVPSDKVETRIEYYSSCEDIKEVYTDEFSSITKVPVDPYYASKQYNLKGIDLEQAWNITTGSSSVIVAVIDTGVDPVTTYTDFGTGTILKGVSIITDASMRQITKVDTVVGQYSYDGGSHGTAVASVIAAGMNSKGITGIAPGVRILPVKVFRDEKTVGEEVLAYNSDINAGIVWAVDHGADIINLSLGSDYYDLAMLMAVRYATDRGVLVVAASGNSSDNYGLYGYRYNGNIKFPAAFNEVISVGSLDMNQNVSNFSDWNGGSLELVAYGEGIYLPWAATNGFKAVDGTSFASPTVAGVLALLLSAYPSLTMAQARSILLSSTKPLGGNTFRGLVPQTGYGIVSAYQTLLNATASVADTNNEPTSAQRIYGYDSKTGDLKAILDKDYYWFETYEKEEMEVTVTTTADVDVTIEVYLEKPDKTLQLVAEGDRYGANMLDELCFGTLFTAGRYYIVIKDKDGRLYKTDEYTVHLQLSSPSPAQFIASTTYGTVDHLGFSNEPVTLDIHESLKYDVSVTLDGAPIATPASMIFSEDGHYVVTVDDVRNAPVSFEFTIDKNFVVSGVKEGKYYNQPVTITTSATNVTLNGEPYVSGTEIYEDGSYTAEFIVGSKTHTIHFVVDKTKPVITGVIEKRYLFETPSITFNEGTALLNGKAFSSGTVITAQGTYVLTVTDLSGNVSTVSFSVLDALDNLYMDYIKPNIDSLEFNITRTDPRATYYRLTWKITGTTETHIETFTSTTYTLEGLTLDVNYTVNLQACMDEDGLTVCSNDSSKLLKTRLQFTDPSYVTNNYLSTTFSWEAVDMADGYNIYVDYIFVAHTTDLSYTYIREEPFDPFDIYRMVIVPTMTKEDLSIYEGPLYGGPVELLIYPKPAAVTNVTTSEISSTSFRVDWSPSDKASYYQIIVVNLSTLSNTISTTTDTNIVLSGFKAGTKYRVEVYAKNIYRSSAGTSLPTTKVVQTLMSGPVLRGSLVNATSIELNWDAVIGASSYVVYEYNPSTLLYEEIANTSSLSITIDGRQTGKTITYMVKASSMVEGTLVYSGPSEPISLTPFPNIVSGFSISKALANGAQISWTKDSSASGYQIWTSSTLNGTYVLSSDVGDVNTSTLGSLLFNSTYYVKIRAYTTVDEVKIYGDFSNSLSFKTQLEIVSGLIIASTGYNINQLSWNSVPSASGYEIAYSTGTSVTYVLLKSLTTTSFSHTALLTNTKYNYKVRAYRLVGTTKIYGAYTSIASSTPLPSAPSITVSSSGYNSLKITWPVVSGANGYEISYASTELGTYTKLTLVTTNSGSISSLLTNSVYFVKVRAYRIVGTTKIYGASSSIVSGSPIPVAPTLSISSLSYDTLKISWLPISGASAYQLYRLNTETSSYELISDTTLLGFNDSGRVSGVNTSYKIKAYRLVGETKVMSLDSTIVSGKAVPSIVTGLKSINLKYTELSLTWSVVSGGSGYEISRSSTLTGVYTVLNSTENLGFTDTGLKFNTTYYYKVRPYTLVDGIKIYGSSTSAISGKTSLENVLDPKAAYGSYNTNLISWSAVNGATGYELYRSIGTSTTYSYLTTTTSLKYTNTSLVTNTKYNYKIRAYRLVGTVKIYGAFSSIVSSIPLPWNPTITVISSGYNSLKVTWPAVSGANGYELSYSTSELGTYTKLALLTTNSASISSLLTNTSYYVKVRAYRIVGTTKVYGSFSSIVSEKPIPATPLMTLISNGYNETKISWPAVSGASGYELYTINKETLDFELILDSNVLTMTHSGLITGQTRDYMIKSYRMVGETKVYSLQSPISRSTPIPSSILGFKLQMPSVNALTLSWASVNGATGYELSQSSTLTGVYVLVSSIENETNYTKTGLNFNTTYYYKIRPYTTVEGTRIYGSSTVALSAKTIPSPVSLSVSNTSYISNTLSWAAVTGASGYEIAYSIGTSTSTVLLKTLTSTSFIHTPLSTNTTYNYKVRAYKLVGTTKIYGAYSSLISAKTLVSKPIVSTSSTFDSVSLSWPSVLGASGYEVSMSNKIDGVYTPVIQSVLTKTYTTLVTGSTYYFKVRAYRLIGTTKVYGAYTDVISVKPSLDKAMLSLSKLESTSAEISWGIVSGAHGYIVSILSNAAEAQWINTTTSLTTHLFTELDPNITYWVKVKAYRTVGEIDVYSEDSSELSFSFASIS